MCMKETVCAGFRRSNFIGMKILFLSNKSTVDDLIEKKSFLQRFQKLDNFDR